MEFEELVKKRASIRRYSSKVPAIESVIKLIEYANIAPSPGNIPILKFVIIEDYEQIEKIADACQQEFIKQAPILVIICSDEKKAQIMYDKRARKYIKQHAGAAIENFLLGATEMGLASCWIGAFSDVMIKRIAGIPDNIEVEAILPVAFQHVTDKTVQRRKYSLEERTFFSRYKNKLRKPFERIND